MASPTMHLHVIKLLLIHCLRVRWCVDSLCTSTTDREKPLIHPTPPPLFHRRAAKCRRRSLRSKTGVCCSRGPIGKSVCISVRSTRLWDWAVGHTMLQRAVC